MALNNKAETAWQNAKHCNCNDEQCYNTHRICNRCNKLMLKCAYSGKESQQNSAYLWNIDHIVPESKGGTIRNDNIIAVHVRCNQKKGNRY